MNKLLANLKSWYGVVFLILLASGIIWIVLNGMPHLNNLRIYWEAQRLQDEWEKPYREDTYGGKTPEETYDMFLDALREGDTTLASRYFVVDEQVKWEKTFDQYKDRNIISDFVKELEYTRTVWKKMPLPSSDDRLFKNTISFEYATVVEKNTTADFEGQKITIPAGNYTNSTTFELNTYTKIWKVRDL